MAYIFLVKQEGAGPQHRLTKLGFFVGENRKGKGATEYTNKSVFFFRYRGQRVGYQSGMLLSVKQEGAGPQHRPFSLSGKNGNGPQHTLT